MKQLLTLLLIYSTLITTSQEKVNFTVESGSLFKNDKREIPIDIIGKDEYGYYVLYSEGKFGQGDELNIKKFNLDLTPSGMEINLKKEEYEGEFNSLGLSKIKNQIIHIYYLLTETGKTYYHQTVDLDKFTLSESKRITEVKNAEEKASNSVSRFIISENEDVITLFYTIPNKNKDFTKFTIKTFDIFFNELSSKTYAYKYTNQVFGLQNIFTDDDDTIYLIGKKFDSKRILKESEAFGYEYLLHKIENDSLKTITSIRPKEVHLRYLKPTITDNNLYLTGLYSNTDMYAMSGVYASKINLETSQIAYEKYNKLSVDFFTQLMEDGKKKDRLTSKFNQGKRDNQNYVIKTVKSLENNDLLLLAEQTRTYSYNYSITYYHLNVAAIRIGNDGNIKWANKIGKNQTRGNVPIYSSFYSTLKDDKILMFYNGNSENIGKKKGKFTNAFNSENSAFICNTIDLDGNYVRQYALNKTDTEGVTIRPALYNWEDENTLVMFGQDVDNLKNQKFIKIKFK